MIKPVAALVVGQVARERNDARQAEEEHLAVRDIKADKREGGREGGNEGESHGIPPINKHRSRNAAVTFPPSLRPSLPSLAL